MRPSETGWDQSPGHLSVDGGRQDVLHVTQQFVGLGQVCSRGVLEGQVSVDGVREAPLGLKETLD